MKESSRIIIKIPPPVVTLLFGGWMFLVDSLCRIDIPIFFHYWLVATLLISASFLLLPAVVQFYKNKTTVNPFTPEKAKVLVVKGVYQYSRNPMYLGMALVLLAWGVFLTNPLNIVIFCCFIFYMNYFQIKPEEGALEYVFGESYQKYKSKVRRWV